MKALTSILLLFLLISCRSIQYVPVETVRTEYKDRIVSDSSSSKEVVNVKDSIRYKDSIVQVVDENGNVLRTEVYKWHDRFRESNYLLSQLQSRYDSLYLVKQDSVQIPYPVEVEKKLTWWQSMKIELGGWAFGLILVAIVILMVRKIIKLRNKL